MSDSQRIRIAIACIILRHKPKEQSLQSYILDLQERFPLCCSCTPVSVTSTQVSGPFGPWRDRAAALETELKALQVKYDEARTELLISKSTPTSEAAATVPASQLPDKYATKKKQKKKLSTQPPPGSSVLPCSSLGEIIKGLGPNIKISDSDGLLASLRALDGLATHTDCSSDEGKELIFLATERAVGAFATTLTSMLPPDFNVAPKAGVFDNLAILFDRLLVTVVPLLCATPNRKKKKRIRALHADLLDSLFGQIASKVLVPLVRSFFALSNTALNDIFRPDTKKASSLQAQYTCDIRPNVLSCVKVALNSLRNLCCTYSGNSILVSTIQGVYELLMLTAVRSLEALFLSRLSDTLDPTIIGDYQIFYKDSQLPEPIDGMSTPATQYARSAPRTTDRLQKLARKDAVWYLCSIMHLTISASAAPASSLTSTLSSSLSPSGSRSSASTYLSASTPPGSSSVSASSPSPPAMPLHALPERPTGLSGPQHQHGVQGSKPLLAEGVCTALAALLRRMPPTDSHAWAMGAMPSEHGSSMPRRRRRDLLDETERAMILAVAERLWLSQG